MGTVTIVGLGAGSAEALPQGTLAALTAGKAVLLRTERHPVVAHLRALGIDFSSLDGEYERAEEFAQVYDRIAERVLAAADAAGEVVFAVPGHPAVAEKSVQLLRERAPGRGHAIVFGPGRSFLDDMLLRLGVDPVEGLLIADAAELDERQLLPRRHLVVVQMYNRALAAEVKMALIEVYGDEHEVTLARAVGVPGEECVARFPLFELDRQSGIDHLTTLYVPPLAGDAALYGEYSELLRLVARLRSPAGGCPWDLAQTHETLRPYAIEEAYEVAHAIDGGDPGELADELGDLLLQVALHAQIGRDEGFFQMRDVIRGLCAKLVRRHPHVFGDASALDAEAVRAQWERVKAEERAGGRKADESELDRVKRALPPFAECAGLHARAAELGFDWPDAAGAFAKVREELRELEAARTPENRREELGDALFAAVNLAVRFGMDPERALREANAKFRRRFAAVEAEMRARGLKFSGASLAQLEELWQNAKENAGFRRNFPAGRE